VIGRKRTEKRGGEVYGRRGKMGKKGMNNDLKIGHVSPKTECVRTHIIAFDRTREECICQVCFAFERKGRTFERIHATVCVSDGVLRSNTQG
jgi:hypothetical protein